MIGRSLFGRLALDASKLPSTQLPKLCTASRSLVILAKPQLCSSPSYREQAQWAQLTVSRLYATDATATGSAPVKAASKVKKPATKNAKPKSRTKKTSTGSKKSTKKKSRGKGAKYSKKAKKAKKVRVTKKPTEKQKKAIAATKERKEVKHLKEVALKQPKRLPATAWKVIFSETMSKGEGKLTERAKQAGARFKSLSSAELEHYNHIANENRVKNEETRAEWLATHSAEEIRLANNARHSLRRRRFAEQGAPKHHGSTRRVRPISDNRQVKRPRTSFIIFSVDRRATGDFKSISLGDAARLIAREWRALMASERQHYVDRQNEDRRRYIKEYTEAYGHPPDFVTKTQKKKA